MQSQCSDCRVSAATIAGSGRRKPDADVNGGDKNAEKNIRGDGGWRGWGERKERALKGEEHLFRNI